MPRAIMVVGLAACGIAALVFKLDHAAGACIVGVWCAWPTKET